MIFLHQANEWTIQSVGAGVVRYTEQIVGVDSAAIDDIERDALRALNKIVEDRGAVAAMQDRLIPGPASERAVRGFRLASERRPAVGVIQSDPLEWQLLRFRDKPRRWLPRPVGLSFAWRQARH